MIKILRKPYVKGLWSQYATIKNCIEQWSFVDRTPKHFNLGQSKIKITKEFGKLGDEQFRVVLQGNAYCFEEKNLIKALKESVNKNREAIIDNFNRYCEEV